MGGHQEIVFPKTITAYCMRHGDKDEGETGAVKLTPLGERQVTRVVREHLSGVMIDRYCSSGKSRARQTAQIAQEVLRDGVFSLPVAIDERSEFDYAGLPEDGLKELLAVESATVDDMARLASGYYQAAAARFLRGLQDVAEEMTAVGESNLLVASHTLLIETLMPLEARTLGLAGLIEYTVEVDPQKGIALVDAKVLFPGYQA